MITNVMCDNSKVEIKTFLPERDNSMFFLTGYISLSRDKTTVTNKVRALKHSEKFVFYFYLFSRLLV